MKETYAKILKEYRETNEKLGQASVPPDQIAALGKQQAAIFVVVEKIQELEKLEKELGENKELAQGNDELAEIAKEEIKIISKRIGALEEETDLLLIPSDPLDDKNIIIEIRAGAGGDESALFAAKLFRMYAKYGESQKWSTHIISSSKSEDKASTRHIRQSKSPTFRPASRHSRKTNDPKPKTAKRLWLLSVRALRPITRNSARKNTRTNASRKLAPGTEAKKFALTTSRKTVLPTIVSTKISIKSLPSWKVINSMQL